MSIEPDPASLDAVIARVLGEFPFVAAAYLFGSAARGELTDSSDIDVGLVFRDPHETALDHHRDLRTIAARLGHETHDRAIDLVVLESQGWVFRQKVYSEGRLVYEADEERRIDFESTTTSRYLDWLPTHEFAEKHALAGYLRRSESRR